VKHNRQKTHYEDPNHAWLEVLRWWLSGSTSTLSTRSVPELNVFAMRNFRNGILQYSVHPV
jgi:hypothetical protein